MTSRGYVQLSSSMTAIQSLDYYIDNQPNRRNPLPHYFIKGPISTDYEWTTDFPIKRRQWHQCHSNLKYIRLIAISKIQGNGNGLLTKDSVDGKVTQKHQIIWKKCIEH